MILLERDSASVAHLVGDLRASNGDVGGVLLGGRDCVLPGSVGAQGDPHRCGPGIGGGAPGGSGRHFGRRHLAAEVEQRAWRQRVEALQRGPEDGPLDRLRKHTRRRRQHKHQKLQFKIV